MTELYPFASHFLDLKGIRYHYLDEGEGPAVVMLHGNPTWSFYYRDLVSVLRGSYRVVVPDHIGCGLSEKPADDRYEYSLRQRASDLKTLLEYLQLTRDITLVVHDWGGMIGMLYAHWHPERIQRLVILNTAAFHLPPGKRLPRSLWWFRNTPLGPWLIRRCNLFCLGACRWCSRRRMAREVRQAYLSPYDNWDNRIAVLRFVQDIPLSPRDASYALVSEVQEGLQRFRQTPVLICWGGGDFVFDRDYFKLWTSYFPHAEAHYFDGAGHYVLEDAGKEITPLVEEFLARTG